MPPIARSIVWKSCRVAGALGVVASLAALGACSRGRLPAVLPSPPAVPTQVSPAPAPSPPSPPAPAPRRVVLLSLDGAAADTLAELDREGALDAGGFSRFFAAGEVAGRLVPVNPTLTAPNHVSLATGYVAGDTGIVSNLIHPAGAAWPATLAGFDAPISTETLWEAARRQGRRVAILTWPGADGASERRRGDWGLIYSDQAQLASMVLSLKRSDFHPVAGARERGEAPALVARAGGYELVARATRDSTGAEYRRLAVRGSSGERSLRPGEWLRLEVDPRKPFEPREPRRWTKLLELDPHLAVARLYVGATYPLRAYPGDFADELARRGLDWPGPPDDRYLRDRWRGQPGIDLDTWAEQAERFAHFFGESLQVAAARPDWNLLMGYLPSIDEAGHSLLLIDPRQPGYSAERRAACELGRRRVWQAVDRELARLLAAVDLATTVVAVVSDHGMAPVHASIDPNALLRERGLLALDAAGRLDPARTVAFAASDGGISHVYLAPAAPERERLAGELRDLFASWQVAGEPAIERVVPRAEAAEVGLASPDSGDLVLFAREGLAFRDLHREKGAGGRPAAVGLPTAYGTHGYLNSHPDMHGIYLAVGAGIAKRRIESLGATEIAGRVAGWMGIEKPRAAAPVPPSPPAGPAGS